MRFSRVTAALCLSLLWLGGLASGASAGWSPATNLGPTGTTPAPAVGFAPTGDAALAYATGGVTMLMRHSLGGGFSAAQPTGADPPEQVVLPAGGGTILRDGATMFVEAPGATAFGPPQSLGGPTDFAFAGPTAVLVPTLRGEVVASVSTSQGTPETAILPRGASIFGAPDVPPISPLAGPVPVAADTAGGAYLVSQSAYGGCRRPGAVSVIVGYRPAGGRFRFSTALRCRRLTDDVPSHLSAAGDGRAVLVTVTRTAPFRPYSLLVQTGRDGQFSAPHVLAHSLTDFNVGAPAIGLGGTVTIAWQTCRRYVLACVVGAAHGSLHHRIWRTQTFADPRNRLGLSGHVGDGYITLQRCAGPRCALSVAYVTRQRFTSPQPITPDGLLIPPDRLVTASGGRARVKLLVWEDSRDALRAATLNAHTGRFGAAHLLSASVAPSSAVAYETGPARQAIVTWINAGDTASAAYYAPTSHTP